MEAKPQPLPAGKQTARLLPPAPDVAAKSDDELAAALVGRWRTNLYGVQTIQNQPGGVASLEAQLDFLSSLLYGSELKMDLEWSVVQGVLTHKIIRGEPEKSVQRLMQDQGDRRSYRILELTESRLKLQNIDEPETVRIWTRMP